MDKSLELSKAFTEIGRRNQVQKIMESNKYCEQFGLTLTEKYVLEIMEARENSLKENRRIEFGESIVPKIIREFSDSDFIDQNNFTSTISRLQEIFFLYKNELNDEITDDELLKLMREQYEKLCFGDLDYLESSCLADFVQAVRAGYCGYVDEEGEIKYDKFSRQPSWNYEVYLEKIRELFGE